MKKQKTKNNNRKLNGTQKFVIGFVFFCFVAIYTMEIFFSSQISNMKMTIEKIDYQINTQEKKNESLNMQVSELTSYENVSLVIEDMGLAYNNKNIVVISK